MQLGSELLKLGLQLDREIERHTRYRLPVQRQVELPLVWAGFRAGDAAGITGDGPELQTVCRESGEFPERLLARVHREHFGLVLYPLPWVSHHWQKAVAIFADLDGYPKRQVFRLGKLSEDLVGFQDAAHFDLFHSRFRRTAMVGEQARRPLLAVG